MQKNPKPMSLEDCLVAQIQHPVIKEITYLISKIKLKGHKMYSKEPQIMKLYLRQHSHLALCKGVLHWQVIPSKELRNTLQLVILENYQKKVLQECHDDSRHMGLE